MISCKDEEFDNSDIDPNIPTDDSGVELEEEYDDYPDDEYGNDDDEDEE